MRTLNRLSISERLFIVGVAVSAVALALAFGLGGQPVWSPVFVALGALWLIGQRRDQGWVASLVLLCLIVGAVLGFWVNLPGVWLLVGAVMALAAWDLHDFARRLQDVEDDADAKVLEVHHLLRLGVVSGLGLLLGGLALAVRVSLGFGVVFALGLIAVFGLSRLVRLAVHRL